jgi:RNA polymerase sigma-70 factor, ECF subfamily
VGPQTVFKLADDFSLIKDFIEGDERAFETLVNRHKEKVRNLIYLNVGDTDAADDIAQDVFVTIYKKLKHFRFESQFTTWLYRITVNKCRDYLRKKKIRSIFSPFTIEEETRPSPERTDESFDIRQIVREAVANLPEKLKTPLTLRDFEGMSYQEIAKSLDLELGTVKSRIFRAREQLKEELEPYKEELI